MEPERKKIRSQPQSVPDRLSELPDLLLLKILSSSMEMTDVFKTSILSKRWKSLWTKVDTLVYHFRLKEKEKGWTSEQRRAAGEVQTEQFISFIDTTLRQHQSNIRRFSYKASWIAALEDDDTMSDLFDYWIECVLEKNVEDFEFDFDRLSDYYPPDCLLYNLSSLTKLKLVRLYPLDIWKPVKLNLLKTLWLSEISLSDKSMQNILSGCPVLESLSLEKIENLGCVDIVSPRVRKLKLHSLLFSGIYSSNPVVSRNFRIRAPWLRELEISGPFLVRECRIEDLSSLVKATLTFTGYNTFSWIWKEEDVINEEKEFNANWIDMAPHLLKALSHVADISIGKELIQVLSLSKLYGQPSPSFQCKHLTINSPLWKYDVLGISCLLENTPHLETLVINVSRPQGECPFEETRLIDDEDMDLSLSKGNFLHLKNVKIDYDRNPCRDNPAHIGGHCNDVEIVGYIMRSAAALERLVLCSSRPGCTLYGGCKKVNCSFMYVPRLSCELQTNFLSSGNEAEEWELKKRKYSYEYRFSNYACQRSEGDSEEVASC